MKPSFSPLDEHWMRRAIQMAERASSLSSPNPTVGCVLAHGDRIAGEGWHEYDQRDHAEIVALKQAGELARSATAYLTLEPCSHHGRTGPCADALLTAGVRRVVVATRDPNPAVNGQGIKKLEAGGVRVDIGLFEEEGRRLNDGFAKYIQTALPFLTVKIATTLDGRIAPSSRSKPAYRITGEESGTEVQRMRHSADALMTGIGTVLADDPLLTDRSGLPRRRPLLRVVLDSSLRIPLGSRLVATANEDLLVFFTGAGIAAQQALRARGVRLEQVQGEGRVALNQVLRRLGEMQLTSILLEGGALLNAAAMAQGLADRLVLFYAPVFLGPNAIPMMGEVIPPVSIQDFSLRRLGENFVFATYLRDPWAGVA